MILLRTGVGWIAGAQRLLARNRTPLALFAIAFLLYLPGIWWGMPEGVAGWDRPWGTDELGPTGAINEVYGVFAANQPTFNPRYPLFHYLVQLAFVAPYYTGLWVAGHISMPAPLFPFGLDHPPTELTVLSLLARFPSLLMGAAIVAIAFRTGEVLRDRSTGLIAAVFVLVQYPMVYYARTSNVDAGALFWTALGLHTFVVCLKEGTTPARWMTFGVMGALATATKDASYAVFLAAAVVLFVEDLIRRRRNGSGARNVLRAPLIAAVVAGALYSMASGLVFRPSRFSQHLQFITTGTPGLFYQRYPATVAGYAAFLQEFWQQLQDAMGVPLLTAAIAGIGWWIARNRRALLLLVPAVALFAGVILPVRFVLLRFVMVITYIAAFAAAELFSAGLAHRRASWRLTAKIALVMVVGWAAIRGMDLTHQMLYDGRHTLSAWLREVVKPGDGIGHVQPRAYLPAVPPDSRPVLLDANQVLGLSAATGPEWFLSLPLEDYEKVHDLDLPDEVYQKLVSGELGYRTVAVFQTASLFERRPATFVNPPVRVFVREDVWRNRALTPPSDGVRRDIR